MYNNISSRISGPPKEARPRPALELEARAHLSIKSTTPGLRYKIPVFSDPAPGKF